MLAIIAVVLAVISIVACVYMWSVSRRLSAQIETALKGSSGQSLEKTLVDHHKHVTAIDERLAELEHVYADLTVTASVASQKISLVRYNPFGDTGGDQSFSLAVLDGHDSGYVLTSIHGRQGTRVYIKPIDFGTSKHSLSDEEAQAINQAMNRIPPLPSKEGKDTKNAPQSS